MARRYKNRKKSIITVITAAVCIAAVIVAYFLNFSGESQITGNSFDTSQDFVRIIDVGQAESILIYSNGYSALFDVGTSESAADICSVLSSCGIEKIDVLTVSHLHDDHIGGIERVMEIFEVDNLVLPEISIESDGLGSAQYAINKVTSDGGEVYSAKQGMNFKIGEFEITVLACYPEMSDENNRSIIAVAEIDGKKFLFTGDAETKVESALLKEGLNLKCDVLSVGHHGSSTSSSEAFLNKVRPRYAAISAGADNMYGHPHAEVLSSLERIGANIYRTDISGDITFYVKNGVINPQTEK